MIDLCGAELQCLEKKILPSIQWEHPLAHVSHIHIVRWEEVHVGGASQVACGASWSRLLLPSVRSNLDATCDIYVCIQASDNVM